MSEVAGTPQSGEDLRRSEQFRLLSAVVVEALRLLPTPAAGAADIGLAQGEGPDPERVEAVAASLRDLHSLVAPDAGVLDWLTTAFAAGLQGEPGDFTVAAIAIRDLLVAGMYTGPTDVEPPDGPADAADEAEASERFATGTIETT